MNPRYLTAALFVLLAATNAVRADKLVLIAGGGSESANGPATSVKLIQPFGIDFDKVRPLFAEYVASAQRWTGH